MQERQTFDGDAHEKFALGELLPFIYTDIEGSRAIRLFQLASGSGDEPIHGGLSHTSLEGGVEYRALSYVWGDPHDYCPVLCNGRELRVGRNLYAALRRLRDAHGMGYFWIDAICINQQNPSERNNQVQMMRDIYATAKEVIIYLGEAPHDATEVLPLLCDIADLHVRIEVSKDEDHERLHLATDSVLKEEKLPSLQSLSWTQVLDFFKSTWFTRVWVIQEAVVAETEPTALYGEHIIPWQTISHAAVYLKNSQLVFRAGLSDYKTHFRHAAQIAWMRSMWHHDRSAKWLRMLSLLACTESFQATNPHDKVFAILGLANDLTDVEGNYIVKVDYAQPLAEVYAAVVRASITQHRNLDALSEAGILALRNLKTLASWVPDWSSLRVWNTLTRGYGLLDSPGQQYLSAHMPSRLHVDGNPDALPVAMIQIDTVSRTVPPILFHHLNLWAPGRVPWLLLSAWTECASKLINRERPREAVMDEFWRTLIANLDLHGRPVPDQYLYHFLSYWFVVRLVDGMAGHFRRQELQVDERQSKTLSEVGVDYLELVKISSPSDCSDDIWREFWAKLAGKDEDGNLVQTHHSDPDIYSRAIYGSTGRQFFTTSSGRMGLGPLGVTEGDQVVILAGGRVPYIVRPGLRDTRKWFELVGDTYLHGKMDLPDPGMGEELSWTEIALV